MPSKISKVSHAVLDIESRKRKASAIIGILKSYKDLKNCKILDIGTGSGIIAHEISKISKKVYSVDIRDERILKGSFIFKKIKDERLPFKEHEFDIVISNHVMAHVKNQELHLKEIKRVLKSNGFAYLSMLNKIWPLEPNFNLLFLSWLPKKFADYYVRITGKGSSYDVNPLPYNKFIEKISGYFSYDDVTIKLIQKKIKMRHCAYRLIKIFSPVWVVILKK